jgi:hypothetical protein
MKRQFGHCALFVVLAFVGCAWAQDETPATPPPASPPSSSPTETPEPTQSTGPKPEYTQVDAGKSLDFLGTAVGRSNLNLGFSLQATYDSNIAAFTAQRQPQNSFLIGPHIGISQYRPKLGLNLSYDGGLGVYQQLSRSDSYAQTASGDIIYQFTSRWQGHAADRYSYSANPFGSYFTVIGQPSPNNPNPNTYVPFATTNQNLVNADLSYVINKYDTITFTGSETFRRYSNYANSYTFTTGLYNMISFNGGANYSHRFSSLLSAGGGYTFTSLDFSHGQQRSGINAIQAFVNYQATKSFSVSGWAGPEYITAKTLITFFGRTATLLQADWVPAFGVNLGWQGLRQSFTTGLSRQVSDGGGLLATTTVYSVNGAYHRRLGARMDGLASIQYGNNASFAATNLNRQLFPDRKFTVLQTIFQLNRQITPQVVATAAYSYVRETQKAIYVVDATGTYNDNRVWFTLQYTWNHPMGQ